MSALLSLLATNAAAAAALAVLAWAAGRAVRRPAVVHGLWLLALAKLLTPPVVPMPVLPSWSALRPAAPRPVAVPIPATARRAPSEPAARVPWTALSPESRPAARPATAASPAVRGARRPGPAPADAGSPAATDRPRPGSAAPGLLLGALAAGSALVAAAAWRRARRFGSLLTKSSPASGEMTRRAHEIARTLGLRAAPPVRLVAGAVPPMLWPTRRGPLLVLPQRLLDGLAADERDALLAHELAHVRRRDHWVRFVELAATVLFWWYPVTWWARRSLRRAEERCCDEWVLRVLPHSAGAYANGLLKSVALIAGAPEAIPLAASGAGPVRDLEARLKEILMTRPLPRLAAPLRLFLAAAAAAGLAVFPIQAASRTGDAPGGAAAPAVAPASTASADVAPAVARAKPAPAPAADAAPVAAVAPPPRPSRVAPAVAPMAPDVALAPPEFPGALSLAAAPRLAGRADLSLLAPAPPEEDPALAAERRALEEQRRALRAQELDLERRALDLEARANEKRLAGDVARLRSEGHAREAERAEKEVRLEGQRIELQKRQLQLEQESAQIEARQEKAADGAAEAEVEAAREALEQKQRALEAEMEKISQEMAAADAEARMDALKESTGDLERSIAEHLDSLREALPEAGARRGEIEYEIQRLQSALDALGSRASGARLKTRTPSPERMKQPAPEARPGTPQPRP